LTTYVRYGPEDRVIDLASLSAADYELITSLHCNIRSGEQVLVCLQRTAGNGEMHIIKRGANYFAAHFAGGAHGRHAVALESDEHKRQKEYWHRAAEDAGYEVAREVGSGNGTILDVAIDGPVKTGIEVQHSKIETPKVKARTTKSYRAGYTTVWFSDQDKNPPWFHLVPSLGCNRLPWHETLPPPRAATATGLRQIEAVRCVVGAFTRCPEGNQRPCGKYHPKPTPWLGLTIDDVARLVPAGEAIPLIGKSDLVYLVSPASADLYRELSGRSGSYEPGGKPKPKKSSSVPKVCVNPVHEELTALVRPLRDWRRCPNCHRRYWLVDDLGLCYDCDRLSRFGKRA
jgi:hypothetical protein